MKSPKKFSTPPDEIVKNSSQSPKTGEKFSHKTAKSVQKMQKFWRFN